MTMIKQASVNYTQVYQVDFVNKGSGFQQNFGLLLFLGKILTENVREHLLFSDKKPK